MLHPGKFKGWNLKITGLKRKFIWSKPSLLGSTCWSSRVCFPPFFSTSNWFIPLRYQAKQKKHSSTWKRVGSLQVSPEIYPFRRRFHVPLFWHQGKHGTTTQSIPLWKLSCFIFEHVNTKGRRNFILEKQPLSGWGHDHPSSANVPWSSGRVCRCVVPLSTVEVLFLFLDLFSEIFLSQLLYECSDRPTSPRMNPNSWRRVIVICALLSACESGLHKEIITH